MGLTLSANDFKEVLKRPKDVLIGVVGQFLIMPLISVIAMVAIVTAVVSVSQQQIAKTGLTIFAVVVLHNLLGYFLGYLFAKLFKLDLSKKKAVSIEGGMQNSGLGAAIATAHFSPLAAVPSAIFSVWHNISGPILATIFSRMKETTTASLHADHSFKG